MLFPDLAQFHLLAQRGNLIPIYRELLADRITPVSAYEKLTEGDDSRIAFLLESVEGGERIGRYSFLGTEPSLIFRSKGRNALILEDGEERQFTLTENEDPLTLLKEILSRYNFVPTADLPRFCGGAVGFLGYDVVRFFETLPDTNPDELDVDDALFLFTDTLLIFDHVRHRVKVLCNAHIRESSEEAVEKAYREAERKIELLLERLRTPHPETLLQPEPRIPKAIEVVHKTPTEDYKAAVERCRNYILAGDAFQVVLSQRFEVEFSASPFDLYRALRSVNPSPYMFYISLGERKLIGTSPEILVTVIENTVRERPIAGSRPRGDTPEEDARLVTELLADEKERAEHIMLVDLGRNDIGRVCEYGTVSVDELMTVEKYSHIMHIVSNVTGTISPQNDVFDVLRACFPAGTVSGAPKVRAMEIIDEQEKTRRGFYAGAVGYFSYSGDMDMAITLRTMWVDGQKAYLQAGGGLVADSVPETEHQECLNKARALVTAIQLAEQGLE